MKVEVYHAKEPNFGFKLAHFPDPKWPDEFTLVAEINSPRNNPFDALDDAYFLTNSIDKPWWEHKSVHAVVDRARSTSVGDVIIVDKIPYKVTMVGFEKIPD